MLCQEKIMKSKPALVMALLCAVLALPVSAASEVEQLRQELLEMRQEYEARLRAMEERLQAAEEEAERSQAVVTDDTAPVAAARRPISGNAFNPAISATVQAKLSRYSVDVAVVVPTAGRAG